MEVFSLGSKMNGRCIPTSRERFPTLGVTRVTKGGGSYVDMGGPTCQVKVVAELGNFWLVLSLGHMVISRGGGGGVGVLCGLSPKAIKRS